MTVPGLLVPKIAKRTSLPPVSIWRPTSLCFKPSSKKHKSLATALPVWTDRSSMYDLSTLFLTSLDSSKNYWRKNRWRLTRQNTSNQDLRTEHSSLVALIMMAGHWDLQKIGVNQDCSHGNTIGDAFIPVRNGTICWNNMIYAGSSRFWLSGRCNLNRCSCNWWAPTRWGDRCIITIFRHASFQPPSSKPSQLIVLLRIGLGISHGSQEMELQQALRSDQEWESHPWQLQKPPDVKIFRRKKEVKQFNWPKHVSSDRPLSPWLNMNLWHSEPNISVDSCEYIHHLISELRSLTVGLLICFLKIFFVFRRP